MGPMDAKQMGAINLLAMIFASIPDPHGVGVGGDNFTDHGEHGISAEIIAPTGDRYRITAEWIGDRES